MPINLKHCYRWGKQKGRPTTTLPDQTEGTTMRYSRKNLIVTAGLAGVLSFGLIGCSASSTQTVETTVTDENGNETTTTTTTQTDESGTTTTETTNSTDASASPLYYVNKGFGFEVTLPEDFVKTEPEPDSDGEETMLYAVNDQNETVFIIWRDLAVEPTFEGPLPWAESYAASLQEMAENNGETSVSITTTEGKLAGVPCIILECRSTSGDGVALYRDLFFMVANTDEGLKGIYVGVTTADEQSLDSIENCFRSIE